LESDRRQRPHALPAAGDRQRLRARVAKQVDHAFVAQYDFAELRLLEANIGCGAARQLAASIAGTEYLAFVDDDAGGVSRRPSSILFVRSTNIRRLVRSERRVVLPSGLLAILWRVITALHDGIIAFEPLARAGPSTIQPSSQDTGRWVGGTAFACPGARSSLEFPSIPACRRTTKTTNGAIGSNSSTQARSGWAAEAFHSHHQETKERKGSAPDELVRAVDFVVPMAHFYMQHGLIQDDLFRLRLRADDAGRNARCRRRAFAARLVNGKIGGEVEPRCNG